MTEEEATPCRVLEFQGNVLVQHEGEVAHGAIRYESGGVRHTRAVAVPGAPTVELTEKGMRPVFVVASNPNSVEIPIGPWIEQTAAWQRELVSRVETAHAIPPTATPEEAAAIEAHQHEAYRQAYAAFVSDDKKAARLTVFFLSVFDSEVVARLLDRTWMSGLLEPREMSWPLVVAGLVFGLLEGWQLADTVLPNIAKNAWFSLLLPLLLVAGILYMSWREQ